MEPFFPLLRNVVHTCGFTRVQSYTDQDISSLSDPFLAKGVITGCILPIGHNEFKRRYLKNLILFSNIVKELFEPIVLQKTTKQKTKQKQNILR